MDPVSIWAPFWEALGNHFGSQNDSKNRVKFRGRFLKVKKLKKGGQKARRELGLDRPVIGTVSQGVGGPPDLDISKLISVHIYIERRATSK